MDSRLRILILIGAIACIGIFFLDIYLGGFVFVLVALIVVSYAIMMETKTLPQVICSLSEDAKSIYVKNVGNVTVNRIHVSLVPLDIEFDIKQLQPDEEEEFRLERMVSQAKAVVKYWPAGTDTYLTDSYPLSSIDGTPFDPLKPAFPLFAWKK